jgi:ferredoxin
VRDCICRVQKDLIGEGCHHPKEVCLTFSPHENAYDNTPATRPISKTEAFEILAQAREAGLIHTTGNYRDGHQYICNCCTCSCGVLRGLAEFKLPTAIAHSNFVATADETLCAGCGDCLERCQFDAISLPDGYAVVDAIRCLGCGQCVSICSTEAMSLQARPRSDREPLPANLSRWMVRRAISRRSNLLNVL